MSCEDIPILLDLQKVKKHADDFGRLMGTGAGTSTNGVTGQVRPTYNKVITDMNSEFDAQIINMGFTRVGTFAAGATLTNPRQTLLWDIADGGDGQEYGWSGSFPKVVTPGGTPLTTGGIAVGAWMSRFDPELRTQVRESLRRSYAEAGYNLVDGSFEAGGVLVNFNDVLLYEASGKAFSGPAGTIAAGTNPVSGGFVDRSVVLLRNQTELALSSTAEMVQKAIIEQGLTKRFNTGGTSWNLFNTSLPITMDNFRAFNAIYVGDLYDGSGDYSDALQNAINKAFTDGCDVFLGSGTKRITKTIAIPMGLNYQHQGTHIYGMGRGKSVLDFDNVNRGSYAIAGFQQKAFDATHGYANCTLKDFSMTNSYGNPSDISAHILMESATGCLWDNLHLSQCVTGIHFTDDAWLNSFTNIFIAPRDYGFRMDNSGTTNWWHGLFVYGSNVTAYKLRSGYSAIGALAADDCTGTAYDLRFFRGSVGALGTEQPTQGRVLSKLLQVDNGSVKIGSLLAFRGVPNSGSWVGVEVGAGQVSIEDFVVDSHDQTAGDKVSTGRLIDGVTGDIKIRNLVVKKDSNGVNAGTLTLAASTLQNSVVSIESPNGTAVAVAGDSHPAIAGSRYNVSPFTNITSKGQVVQSVVFDNYGNPKHGGSTLDNKYRYTNGYQSGSIFLENAPARWGCAGYVATNTSNDIDGQTTTPIAAVNTSAPIAPHVGVSYFDTVTNKPYWWNGSVWKDAAGVTKP